MKRFAFNPYLLIVWSMLMLGAGITGRGGQLLMVVSCGTPIVLLFGVFWPASWEMKSPKVLRVIAVPLVLLAIPAVVSQWTPKVTFWTARSGMNTVAARLERGEQVKAPLQIGPYTILKAEVNDRGVVCLWTDVDQSGSGGFVKTSSAKVGNQFNLWGNAQMDDQWQFIKED